MKSQILMIIVGTRGVTILVPNKHDTLVVFGNKVLLRKIKVMFVKILKRDLDRDLTSD